MKEGSLQEEKAFSFRKTARGKGKVINYAVRFF